MSNQPIIIESGQPAPGAWIIPEGSGEPLWQGPIGWGTRHGQAILHRLYGLPAYVENALTDDGRLTVEVVRNGAMSTWRRRANHIAGGWSIGEIQVGPAEIVFRDDPNQVDPSVSDLVRDIGRDPALMGRLQDDEFAGAFYEHASNRTYRFSRNPHLWGGSGRLGELVSQLRGLCEDSLIFEQYLFLEPQDAEDSARHGSEIDAHLARIGWARLSRDEEEVERRQAASEVAVCERRPEGECPLWAMSFRVGEPVGYHERLIIAARAGKLTLSEYEHIASRL